MYSKINHFLHRYDGLILWKAIHQLVDMIIKEKPKHIRIPGLIGEAYSCAGENLLPPSACLSLAFASIIVMDDVLDGDGRFSGMGLTSAELANLCTAMNAAAFKVIHDFSLKDSERIKAVSILSDMLFKVAHGQALDVRGSVNEPEFWEVARLKSGAFFSGTFGLGGVACGVDEDDLEVLCDLGCEFGILIQIHDDLRDALAVPASMDWENGRHPLPILFAEIVNHPWRERFLAIRPHIGEKNLLEEAQEILLRCGAISYGMDQIEKHHADAMRLVDRLDAKHKLPLIEIFDDLRRPVESLMEGFEGCS